MKLKQLLRKLNFIGLWTVGSIITGVEFYILDYFFTRDPNIINAIVAGALFGLMFALLFRYYIGERKQRMNIKNK